MKTIGQLLLLLLLLLLLPLLLGCRGGRAPDCSPAELGAARELWARYCVLADANRHEERNRTCAAFEKTGPAGFRVVAEVLATPGAAHRGEAACILQSFMAADPLLGKRGQELIWPYLGDKEFAVSSMAAVVLSRFGDDSLPDRAVELLRRNIRPGPSEGYVEDNCLETLARLPYGRVRAIFLEQLKVRLDEPFRNTPSPGACLMWDLPLAFVVKHLVRQNDPEANEALLELARHRFAHPPEGAGARGVQLYYLSEALGQLRDERSVDILIEQATGERFTDPAQNALERLTGQTDLHGKAEWRRWADGNRGRLLKPVSAGCAGTPPGQPQKAPEKP